MQSRIFCINVHCDKESILMMHVFIWTVPFLIKVSKKITLHINLYTKACLIYNLEITTALNRKLSGYFICITDKDCWKSPV